MDYSNKLPLLDNVLIKISGEYLSGNKEFGRNPSTLSEIADNISKEFKKLLVEKASILINGVSLTISKIKNESFEIWIIPHTLKLTNLSYLAKNDIVNVEIDILSKYTKKFINEKK